MLTSRGWSKLMTTDTCCTSKPRASTGLIHILCPGPDDGVRSGKRSSRREKPAKVGTEPPRASSRTAGKRTRGAAEPEGGEEAKKGAPPPSVPWKQRSVPWWTESSWSACRRGACRARRRSMRFCRRPRVGLWVRQERWAGRWLGGQAATSGSAHELAGGEDSELGSLCCAFCGTPVYFQYNL